MAQIVEDFLLNFHNLEGLTVADRQKKFFRLLHQNAPVLKGNVEFLEAISTNLNPRTFLESLFKVDFLIYFRRTEELLQLLKEGNDVFVSKIVKQVWFFKEAFNEISASQLVNEILPNMSFSVRMKVLRKLSQYSNCEKFDHIFDPVVARYGIFIASQFITGCSSVKIRQTLIEYPMKLTSTQLRILYEKDHELIDFYFSHSNYSIKGYPYVKLVKFIFVNDPIFFDSLKEKYKISVRLGRRTTKKFVANEKVDIVKNPHDFYYLNMPAVLRKIGKDSVNLFKNALLPNNMVKCINKDWLFKSFSKKYHYSLFVKTFQDHYGIHFLNYPFLIDEDLLKLIPDNLDRATLAKVKVDEGHDEYLKYLLTEDSIRLIKEKINLTSNIQERGKLIKYLVETCHINNNIDALLSVMKFFCFRHKNDELNVHLQFINNIENLFGFTNFTEEMWNYLNELLMIHTLKFDQNPETYKKIQTLPLVNFNLGTSAHQKLSYLEFLFKKGESIDELIKEYSNDDMEFPRYKKYDKQFEKYFLLFVINNIATDSLTQKNVIFNCKLIKEIDHWNYCYKDDQLSFSNFTKLVQAALFAMINDDIKYRGVYTNVFRDFRSKIFTTEENVFRKQYLKIFWDRSHYYITLTDLHWFLKHDPLTIVTNFDQFFQVLIVADTDPCNRIKLWFMVKKYSHLQLDEKSVQLCLAELSDDTNNIQMKQNCIPCLSVLMKPGDYAALADTYKPANKKLDLKNETEIRLYNLQCAIAKQFKNTKSCEVLTSLLNYCAGDYFKYAMRSLYSMLYHTPENMLPQYLNYLSTKAVSVRKHALFLTCELSTSTKVENIIRLLNKQEEVQSLQKHVFSSTIQYFVKNPSDPFFELVKLNMVFINKADDESLNDIARQMVRIPTRYKAQYIQYAWEFLEKTVDIWKKLAPLKRELLNCVTEITEHIPLELGLRIIQQHFMTENGARDLININTFMWNFLSAKTEKSVIFETIFAIVDERKNEKGMFTFFHDWFYKTMKLQSNDLKYLEPFVTYYEKKVSVVEYFGDFIKIFFLRLKLDWPKNGSVDNFAVKVVTFFEDVVSKYGVHVIHLFAHEMKFNVSNYFIGGEIIHIYDFYCSIIRHRPVPTVAILVLEVLSKPLHKDDSFVTFDKLLRHIKDIDDIGVQINLQSKFRDYQVPEEMEVDEHCSGEYGLT